jgi:DNA-binding FrmR family transcriptional regulator
MRPEIKKSVLRRLKIAAGQIGGLERLVEEDTYCVDIITQSAAVREALAGIERLMLENHLATHVVHQMKSGKSNQAVAEILKVYRLAQKKNS